MNTQRLGARLRSFFAPTGRRVKQTVMRLATWRTGVIVCVLLVALQIAAFTVNYVRQDQPILGLRLEGQVIGWPNSDFRKQTDVIVHEYENKTVSVKAADITSSVTLRQFGVDVNEDQLHEQIIASGRTGNILARLSDQGASLFTGQNLSIYPSGLNSEIVEAYITSLDQKIDVAPTNAYFVYQDHKATVHPDAPGRIIHTEAAIALLSRANPLRTPEIMLPIKQTTATVTTAMLEPLLPQVQAIAQKPLTITAGSSQAVLTPEQLVGLVVPKIIADPSHPDKMIAQITFDESKLLAIVDEVIKQAVVAPKPTIMNGRTVLRQGQNGIQTEDSHSLTHVLKVLIQRQTGAASPDIAQIPLVEVSPPVVQQAANTARNRTGTGFVRLTFDDGPGGYTGQVLDVLDRYNVHASFYVIGRNVAGYTGQMQRIANEGHAICNHSFNHPDLARMSWAGVQQELSATQTAVQQAAGVTPTCFRPPYGSHNSTVRQVAASLGMSVDMWSVDPRDWARPGSSVITQRVLNNLGSGSVILLHSLSQQTVDALPGIIEGIRAQGYTLE